MKKLTAIIRRDSVQDVVQEIARNGLAYGATMTEVKGFGRQSGKIPLYEGVEYTVAYVPKVALEIVLLDENLEDALGCIKSACTTGAYGDGKIFIEEIVEVVRIRTGETGEQALSGPKKAGTAKK